MGGERPFAADFFESQVDNAWRLAAAPPVGRESRTHPITIWRKHGHLAKLSIDH
jgi:hypothetical protein